MRRAGKPFVVAMVAGCVASLALAAAGGRVNSTKSLPVGLYWTSNGSIVPGAYVLFCPPVSPLFSEAKRRGYIGAGFCPGDYGYLMKQVGAAEGDIVAVDADGVRVNGALLALSAPVSADSGGLALPRLRIESRTLDASEVLLVSKVSATSFDGRYFGLVDRSQIKSVVHPIITW